MARPDAAALFDALPKAELHLHIEGSLEPEMLFALAGRNGVQLPYSSVAELRAAYDFSSLQDFLDLYYQGMAVLRTERDFYDLTNVYLRRARADGVRHAEIFFDPQGHTERGVPFSAVVTGIHRALEDGARDLGVTSRLIMCFLRHLSEASALETLDAARSHLSWIHGVGLDSTERDNPPSRFQRVFAKAAAMGLPAVAHAGEEGPPEYVRQALDLLRVRRVDHGNSALSDPALMARLARDRVPLTVCPLSNLRLRGVANMAEHPLPRMLELGLCATVNSDDPAYFGGYVNANFRAVHAAQPMTAAQAATLARNSFEASFLPNGEKQMWLDEINKAVLEEGRHV